MERLQKQKIDFVFFQGRRQKNVQGAIERKTKTEI